MPGDRQINIRVTQEQLTEIQERAKQARMSVTLFLLRSALGEMDRFTPTTAVTEVVQPAAPKAPVMVKAKPAPSKARIVPADDDDDEDELFDGMMRSNLWNEELSERYNKAKGIWEPWEG